MLKVDSASPEKSGRVLNKMISFALCLPYFFFLLPQSDKIPQTESVELAAEEGRAPRVAPPTSRVMHRKKSRLTGRTHWSADSAARRVSCCFVVVVFFFSSNAHGKRTWRVSGAAVQRSLQAPQQSRVAPVSSECATWTSLTSRPCSAPRLQMIGS